MSGFETTSKLLAEIVSGPTQTHASMHWLTVHLASRITLWGQSAGAASVDYNNFAFYEFVS